MVYRILTSQNGHFYVCGDYRMAEDVMSALKIVFQKAGGLSPKDSEALFAKLKVYSKSLICAWYMSKKYDPFMQEEKRYHEDIFGVTYRAPDVIKNRANTKKTSILNLPLPSVPMTYNKEIKNGTPKTARWSKISEFSFFGCFKKNKWEPATLINF